MLQVENMKEIGKMTEKQEKVSQHKTLQDSMYFLNMESMKVKFQIVQQMAQVISLHFLGTFSFPNGEQYTGEWRDGVMEGEGCFFIKSQELTHTKEELSMQATLSMVKKKAKELTTDQKEPGTMVIGKMATWTVKVLT